MSKELEARKTLNKYRNYWYNEVDKEKVEVANALDVLLPFPTEEEVCEALESYGNNYFGKVSYNKVHKIFYSEDFCFIARDYFDVEVVIEEALPPHLIIMIARFYEGVIENE